MTAAAGFVAGSFSAILLGVSAVPRGRAAATSAAGAVRDHGRRAHLRIDSVLIRRLVSLTRGLLARDMSSLASSGSRWLILD